MRFRLVEELEHIIKFVYIPTDNKEYSYYYNNTLKGYIIFWKYVYDSDNNESAVNYDKKYAHCKVIDTLPSELKKHYYAGYVDIDFGNADGIEYIDGKALHDYKSNVLCNEVLSNIDSALDLNFFK